MTTILNVCILVVWFSLVLTHGTNGEVLAVPYEGQRDADDIIIKLKSGGTTNDIKNILNNHSKFKLGRQFDLLGETYFELVSDKDYKPRAGTIKPMFQEDEDIISIRHDPKVDAVVNNYRYLIAPRVLNGNPELDNAWYTTRQRDVKVSMNIDKAWKKGYSGKNVVVALLDTQVQLDHDDLGNIDAENSTIYFSNNQTNQEMEDDNVITGTALAGVIAATKDNGICTTGVAYNAKVQAVAVIEPVSRTIIFNNTLNGLVYNIETVDIYTATLGKDTNKGFSENKNFYQVDNQLYYGAVKGRNGKGSIYVFGAGDGGPKANAAVNDYAFSIASITISSVEYDGVAEYGEIGSNIMAVGYGGSHRHKLINYIYPDNKCSNTSDGIYGTSFAAAQVAGIIALALEANPDLTFRDVQHLIVRSSSRYHFKDKHHYQTYKWKRNGRGFFFHPKMGFGLVNALKMVNLAKRWKTAPSMKDCFFTVPLLVSTARDGKYLISNLQLARNNCSIRFIENVQLGIGLKYSKLRGYTEIDLVSPRGTVSPILTERPDDNADTLTSDILYYYSRTVHFWGENTIGNWKRRTRSLSKFVEVGPLVWQVRFFGTTKNPRI